MVLTKKQANSGKKDQGKKGKEQDKREQNAKKDADSKAARKETALSKEKKEVTRKEPAKREVTAKKERVNYVEQLQKFFRGSLSELKKVHWPNRRETIIYTSVVMVAVVVVGVLIWVFDSVLSTILKLIMTR
ncbi:hypothetical membrane protein [Pelotomaculum thermopropionicum SI]|uniref:Protein translocase subunit SecE n=1 Tax=Pelotomaculum thermopropionicum (strain DSM 13744 / JCM 10971 / SI) TaxID=370438 RepID=A5D5K2_PELTS|nr:hypothetical membrane protein [Pelotomaculum thermopropionicum SI]